MNSKIFAGTKEEVQDIFKSTQLEVVSLGENKDLVSYRIKITSEKDLETLNHLLGNEFQGTITLAE